VSLTSHQEEQSRHILHQLVVFPAAQQSNRPAEHNDGHSHADKTCSHPLQICTDPWGKTNRTECERLQ